MSYLPKSTLEYLIFAITCPSKTAHSYRICINLTLLSSRCVLGQRCLRTCPVPVPVPVPTRYVTLLLGQKIRGGHSVMFADDSFVPSGERGKITAGYLYRGCYKLKSNSIK